MDSTYVTVAAGAVVLALLLRCMAPKSNTPLPPGPRGWPIVGCMFEMPARVRHPACFA